MQEQMPSTPAIMFQNFSLLLSQHSHYCISLRKKTQAGMAKCKYNDMIFSIKVLSQKPQPLFHRYLEERRWHTEKMFCKITEISAKLFCLSNLQHRERAALFSVSWECCDLTCAIAKPKAFVKTDLNKKVKQQVDQDLSFVSRWEMNP